MKIKTKFKLMYWPVKTLVNIIGFIPCVLGVIAFAIYELIDEYEDWCYRKSGWWIMNEDGREIINPKVEEE